MTDEQAAVRMLDIYKNMQSIYMTPIPDRPLTRGELMDLPTMENRIEAAAVALRCMEWLEQYLAKGKP